MSEAWKQWEGQVVDGKFHLRKYLGGTEDSAVFLTERPDEETEKAAIKLIAADPEIAEQQLSRWALAERLDHPHLMRIFQTGRCRLGDVRLLYVVMEYAEENLAQIIPQRSLSALETQEMLPPVLEALAYLHSQGLAHGHVKPSNIMAVEDQLKISSDGLCAAGEKRAGHGSATVYDAPEAATRGGSPAGDVWSLGVTLVEVLTRKLPVWEWKGQEEPELPKPFPAPFGDIARACLRRDPQVRWTIAAIGVRLQPDAPAAWTEPRTTPRRITSARLRNAAQLPAGLAKLRYIVPAAAVALAALLVIFASTRLFNRHQETKPEVAIAQYQPKPAPPAPVRDAAPPSERAVAEKVAAKQPPAVSDAPTTAKPLPKVTAKPAPAGELVKGGVANQVVPDVPQKARDTIRGIVRVGVRVEVDASGSVATANLDSPGPSRYFAKLALDAARNWKFTPAMADGQYAASEWVLRFQFAQDGTRVIPVEATP
ncbi:MAG TPA: TonB family protein [Candidatus Acidoferrales bacterium]|nr:TonB family protein [Candidatus Acidoferrales bacterium]